MIEFTVRACPKTLELSSGSAHVNVKTFQSQQIGALEGLGGSAGGITSVL